MVNYDYLWPQIGKENNRKLSSAEEPRPLECNFPGDLVVRFDFSVKWLGIKRPQLLH